MKVLSTVACKPDCSVTEEARAILHLQKDFHQKEVHGTITESWLTSIGLVILSTRTLLESLGSASVIVGDVKDKVIVTKTLALAIEHKVKSCQPSIAA